MFDTVKNSLGSNWLERTPTLNIEWGQIDPKVTGGLSHHCCSFTAASQSIILGVYWCVCCLSQHKHRCRQLFLLTVGFQLECEEESKTTKPFKSLELAVIRDTQIYDTFPYLAVRQCHHGAAWLHRILLEPFSHKIPFAISFPAQKSIWCTR